MIALVRRWAVDWLASHDPGTCAEIMHEDYRLTIGAVELADRSSYVEGTMGQLSLFPGLCLTVHEVVATARHAAVRFTEHGAGAHKDGRVAAWGGIALFESDGGLLARTWAEEDYASRSRQLRDGVPDPVEAPAVAPWDTPILEPGPAAERVVLDWLGAGLLGSPGVLVDDAWLHPSDDGQRGEPDGGLELDVLFSAGSSVAFHGRRRTADGFAQGVAGLVRVGPDGTPSGRVVTDRHGAHSHARSARG